MKTAKISLLIALLFPVLTGVCYSQISHVTVRPLAENVLVPQSRSHAFAPGHHNAVEITGVEVLIDILEITATTTVELKLENNTNARQEAEVMFPVPDGAVVKGFAYDGPGGQISAKILPKEEARKIYQQLVAQIRDPALVEFVGYNLLRSSVFPVEPRGKQKVRLTYEHLLETDGNRIDYLLPRTESLEYSAPWDITANIKADRPISTVYSASHELDVKRISEKEMKVSLSGLARKKSGHFRLSYLLEDNGVTASMFAYPDENIGGGYFLLLAGVPIEQPAQAESVKREVTLVIDRSGSMRNEKIKQVKEAALQIISGLQNGEAFNIIIYSNTVELFANQPVIKSARTEEAAKAYIEGITATGGTNIHDALLEALSQKPSERMLPLVLFLTDGLPTVGNTSEVVIRELVTKSNPYNRRVFTFGVGVDVNAPLLEKLAYDSKAKPEFVLPDENVEVKIGRVFKRLSGPVLSDVRLEILEKDGSQAIGRTRDILPDKLPDLFENDQLILLGQYVRKEPLHFRLSGDYFGKKRSFEFTFEFDKASVKNGFVPRLWASRKIAQLIDAVRQAGADENTSANDPKIKELIDEIVRLSTEFGILTEYTAFLAREGTELERSDVVSREAADNFEVRAMRSRSGMAGVNQSVNSSVQKQQSVLNYDNSYYDADMNRVSVANVQQINDRAYYRRGNQWIDSRLVSNQSQIKPKKVIEFASDEFMELAQKLAAENRQGTIALEGDILLLVDGELVLIKNPLNN